MSLKIDTTYGKYINDIEIYRNPLPIFYDDLKEYLNKNTIASDLELLKKIFDEMKKRSYPIGSSPSIIPLLDDDGNVVFSDPNTKFHEYIIKKIKERLMRKDDIIEILTTKRNIVAEKKGLKLVNLILTGGLSEVTNLPKGLEIKGPSIKTDDVVNFSDWKAENGFMR